MYVLVVTMVVSVVQRSVELQSAVKSFMASTNARLEICQYLIIHRIRQGQFGMGFRLRLRAIDLQFAPQAVRSVSEFFLSLHTKLHSL